MQIRVQIPARALHACTDVCGHGRVRLGIRAALTALLFAVG